MKDKINRKKILSVDNLGRLTFWGDEAKARHCWDTDPNCYRLLTLKQALKEGYCASLVQQGMTVNEIYDYLSNPDY